MLNLSLLSSLLAHLV